jgi:hypothetical protein
MEAGISSDVWSIEEIIGMQAAKSILDGQYRVDA